MCDNEEWNKVHAQLLKSVADAQAKLLAAQNETADDVIRIRSGMSVLQEKLDRWLEAQKPREPRTATEIMTLEHEKERAERFYAAVLEIPALSDKLNEIGAQLASLLAPPRRQVERLRTKRIVKRATSKEKRHA